MIFRVLPTKARDFAMNAPRFATKARDFAMNVPAFATKTRDFAMNAPRFATKARNFAMSAPAFATKARNFAMSAPAFATKARDFAMNAPGFAMKTRDFAMNAPGSASLRQPAGSRCVSEARATPPETMPEEELTPEGVIAPWISSRAVLKKRRILRPTAGSILFSAQIRWWRGLTTGYKLATLRVEKTVARKSV